MCVYLSSHIVLINEANSARQCHPIGHPHPVYTSARANIHDIQRAKIKAKLLTGTDILQANRSRFKQYKVDPTCGLCLTHLETREHFISHCISLSDSRRCFITKAVVLQVKPEVLTTLEPAQFTQPCLDCTHPNLQKDIKISYKNIQKFKLHTREYTSNKVISNCASLIL